MAIITTQPKTSTRRSARIGSIRRSFVPVAVVVAASCGLPEIAGAQEANDSQSVELRPQLGLRAGYGHTDNVLRDETEQSSGIAMVGLRFAAGKSSTRFDGRAAADVEHRSYRESSADDELIGSIDGTMDIGIVPERFAWGFEQSFGQMRVDPFAPVGPGNRERVVVFGTGPRLQFPVGARNDIEIGADIRERRYSGARFLDSRLTSGRFALVHALDSVTDIALEFQYTENEYEALDNPYEFRILSATYNRAFSSGGVEFRLGRGEVEIGANTTSTSVARFQWRRGIGARSSLNVWAGRELTDAGELFRIGGFRGARNDTLSGLGSIVDINDDRLRGIVLSGDPLRQKNAGAAIDLIGVRTTVRLSVALSEDDFETDDLFDNDLRILKATLSHDFNPRWSGRLGLSLVRQDFFELDRDNEDFYGDLVVTREMAEHVRLSLAFERNRREDGIHAFGERTYLAAIEYQF